jgi:hypothetical protein
MGPKFSFNQNRCFPSLWILDDKFEDAPSVEVFFFEFVEEVLGCKFYPATLFFISEMSISFPVQLGRRTIQPHGEELNRPKELFVVVMRQRA